MVLKILQLNIWQGAFFDEIISFVKKEDFDVLHFQEVTGGRASMGGTYIDRGRQLESKVVNEKTNGADIFQLFSDKLSNYVGKKANIWNVKNDPSSYMGIATFVKKKITLESDEVVWLKPFEEVESVNERNVEDDSRCALVIKTHIEDKTIFFINTHLAWSREPIDTPSKIEQAKKLEEYLKTIQDPYVFTGDFNVKPDTEVVKMFSRLANNVGAIYDISNTLNPRIHAVKELFPAGLCVDYIFAHPLFHIKKFKVIDDIDLSDHFAVTAELEL